jgi:hypothetical protein
MLGEKVSVRKLNNRVVVTNRPQRKLGPPTEKQLAVQDKFLEATQYARAQTEDPETLAIYTKGITNKKKQNAFGLALTDYLNAPKVNAIKAGDYKGVAGDVIKVHATDDFKVTRVRVIISDSAGKQIEQGEAIQDVKKNHIWSYTATVANATLTGSKITATAFDIPENETTLELVL